MSRRGARVLVVVGVLTLTVGCSDDEGAPSEEPAPAAESTESTEPADLPALPEAVTVSDAGGETITAEPFADFMVAAGDEIWVSGVEPGVVAYDAASAEITHEVPFEGDVVQAMEADGRTVYAAAVGPDELLTVDARTGAELARTPLDGSPLEESSVTANKGTAWVLVDVDAPRFVVVEGGQVTGKLPAPEGALAARFGFGSLWVTVGGGQVARVNPGDGAVLATYEVGTGARFLTIGDDAVWTLDAVDGTVSRIDAETGEVGSILVSDGPISGGDIAADVGVVWARTTFGVTRVDPATLTATHLVSITPGSGSVAAAAGWMWLSDHDHFAVHRVPLESFQ